MFTVKTLAFLISGSLRSLCVPGTERTIDFSRTTNALDHVGGSFGGKSTRAGSKSIHRKLIETAFMQSIVSFFYVLVVLRRRKSGPVGNCVVFLDLVYCRDGYFLFTQVQREFKAELSVLAE